MEVQTKEPVNPRIDEANERSHIVSLVRSWGGSASDAVLDACQLFMNPSIEGIVGYKVESQCAIVFGDPICAPKDLSNLVETFHHFCQSQGWGIIYVTATEQFASWALQKKVCKTLIEFGEELVLDPHNDPRKATGVHASLVRRKVRHAQHEGTTVKEYVDKNLQIEQALEQVCTSWLQSRKGPQIFTSHARLFADRQGKRWFYAEQGGNIVGVIVLNRLESRKGWLVNHLMTISKAPHGTPELLVTLVLEALEKEGCHHVTFGSVTSGKLGKIIGLGPLSSGIARMAFKLALKIFRLNNRKKFWEKFHPQSMRSFLLFDESHIALRNILGLMRALNVSL